MSKTLYDTNIDNILISSGIKPTANRIIVLKELLRGGSPKSIAEIEDLTPSLDKSSIFRTLTLFFEHGLVHALEDGRGVVRYEFCHAHDDSDTDNDQHPHFYCEVCHEVTCLDNLHYPSITLPEGYETHSINYMIKGVCPKCGKRS